MPEEKEKTVTMVFPNDVLLTITGSQRMRFKQGVQEVPESLVDHPYLKAHGVQKYDPNKKTPVAKSIPGLEGPKIVILEETELNAMTKPMLVDHAKKMWNLDLDPNAKKDDLISDILDKQDEYQEAQEAKNAAKG